MESTASTSSSMNTTIGEKLDKLKEDFFIEVDKILDDLKGKEVGKKTIAELQKKNEALENAKRAHEEFEGIENGTSQWNGTS